MDILERHPDHDSWSGYLFVLKRSFVRCCLNNSGITNEYHKDKSVVDIQEKNGTVFNIMHNNDIWVVTWVKDNVECSIFVDCQEDVLNRILESIYVMEE